MVFHNMVPHYTFNKSSYLFLLNTGPNAYTKEWNFKVEKNPVAKSLKKLRLPDRPKFKHWYNPKLEKPTSTYTNIMIEKHWNTTVFLKWGGGGDLQFLALKKNAHIIQQLCPKTIEILYNFKKNALFLSGLPEAHFPLQDLKVSPIKEICVFDLWKKWKWPDQKHL